MRSTCVICLSVVLFTPGVRAQETSGVYGVLKADDSAKGTITLTVQGGKGKGAEDRVFDVAKDAKVVIDDVKQVKFADVPLGSHVAAKLSDNKVVSATATGPAVSGILKSVDGKKRTITLTIPARKGTPEEERSYDVAKTARITGDGDREAKLSDLFGGARVGLTLSVDQKEAIRISAVTARPQGSTVKGTLTSLDADKNTITLLVGVGKGNPGETRTFEVPKTVKITVDLVKEGKLADLKSGSTVGVDLSEEQKVTAVRAFGPTVFGLLKSLDREKGSLTLTINIGKGNPGEDKPYKVVRDVFIINSRNELLDKRANVPTGVPVTLTLSVDREAVVLIKLARDP